MIEFINNINPPDNAIESKGSRGPFKLKTLSVYLPRDKNHIILDAHNGTAIRSPKATLVMDTDSAWSFYHALQRVLGVRQ